ncbi:hypothetical protein C6P52_01805 [Enterococcus mundtii]|nr:hypothetical protein C6P52_01805 [Enterococcus mundtii]PTO44900.1 hypothetical protein C6P54_02460 [Enterococcus mundtii]
MRKSNHKKKRKSNFCYFSFSFLFFGEISVIGLSIKRNMRLHRLIVCKKALIKDKIKISGLCKDSLFIKKLIQ